MDSEPSSVEPANMAQRVPAHARKILLRLWSNFCPENRAKGFGVRRQDAALSSFKAVPWRRCTALPRRFAYQSRNAGFSCALVRPRRMEDLSGFTVEFAWQVASGQ